VTEDGNALEAAEVLFALAVETEGAADDLDGWPSAMLRRAAAHLAALGEALAAGDYEAAAALCPPMDD
jgi:hypothetical protein